MLRRYAKGMKFDLLTAFHDHKKANTKTVVLDNACAMQLKLFTELTPFSNLIPRPTSGGDMHTHGPQKHIFEESDVIVCCLPRAQHYSVISVSCNVPQRETTGTGRLKDGCSQDWLPHI
jgi:hypothetical protein